MRREMFIGVASHAVELERVMARARIAPAIPIPEANLNPLLTIGRELGQVIVLVVEHQITEVEQNRERLVRLLRNVVPSPRSVNLCLTHLCYLI